MKGPESLGRRMGWGIWTDVSKGQGVEPGAAMDVQKGLGRLGGGGGFEG